MKNFPVSVRAEMRFAERENFSFPESLIPSRRLLVQIKFALMLIRINTVNFFTGLKMASIERFSTLSRDFFIVFFQKVSVFSVICGIGKDLWGLGLPISLFYLPLLAFQLECMQGFYRNSCNATHSHFEPLQG